MWIWLVRPALAAPPAEEVCVSVMRDLPVDLLVPPPSPALTRFRAAAANVDPLPAVPIPALLDALDIDPPSERFTVDTAAMGHPADPDQVLLSVRANAPEGGLVPLQIVLVLDTSPSMHSVPQRVLPALQDEGPDAPYRAVSRIDIAKAAARELVHRLPARTRVAVVAADRGRGTLLLPATPITEAPQILGAIDVAKAGPRGDALAEIGRAARPAADPCTDVRILLLTDGHARLHPGIEIAQAAVAQWRQEGSVLWVMSIGTLGQDMADAQAITRLGGGLHLAADTLGDATRQLQTSLRASGTVGRDLTVSITGIPGQIESLVRLDGPTDAGTWTLDTIAAGERVEGIYAARLAPGADLEAPVAQVAWSVSSPWPGEWERGATPSVTVRSDEAAPIWLRDRAVAVRIGSAFGASDPDWSAIARQTDALAGDRGLARELTAWAHLLAETPPTARMDAPDRSADEPVLEGQRAPLDHGGAGLPLH